jgi:hypothetical protein
MFAVVGLSIWFSVTTQAPVERWISFLMVILVLLHLAEINNPFRSLNFSYLLFEPPFANESSFVTIQIENPTDFASEPLRLRLEGIKTWTTLPNLSPQTTRTIRIPLPPLALGKHPFPKLRLNTRPASDLFHLWKILTTDETIFVLPPVGDQGIAFESSSAKPADSELSHLEAIRDERLMSKMDSKIFLKTGKPYYRAMESAGGEASVRLEWSKLFALSHEQQGEQFSAWLKESRERAEADNVTMIIDTPFFKTQTPAKALSWPTLKERFAEWFLSER